MYDQNLMVIKVIAEEAKGFIRAIAGQIDSLNFYAEITIKPLY